MLPPATALHTVPNFSLTVKHHNVHQSVLSLSLCGAAEEELNDAAGQCLDSEMTYHHFSIRRTSSLESCITRTHTDTYAVTKISHADHLQMTVRTLSPKNLILETKDLPAV